MKSVLLEVFIEDGCKSCVAVLYTVRSVQADIPFEVKVYRRDTHQDIFKQRKVVITPAIFINGVLTFYGECTRDQIINKVHNEVLNNHTGNK